MHFFSFLHLRTYIHLNDNSSLPDRNDPNYDKLYRVRPFLNIIQANFLKCYNLTEHCAIDESMIKFKGRCSMKQYMPNKPVKRGYKVWVLADQSGYCYKFNIYTGKSKHKVEKSLGENVVKKCEGLEFKNHKLYFDNYFSSVKLLEDLKQMNIYKCATINPTQKELPIFKSDKILKQGDFDYYTSDSGLYVVKWKDKRSVHLISNYHNPDELTTVQRKDKTGKKEDIPCPKVLVDYNRHMNAVDKLDQLKSAY